MAFIQIDAVCMTGSVVQNCGNCPYTAPAFDQSKVIETESIKIKGHDCKIRFFQFAPNAPWYFIQANINAYIPNYDCIKVTIVPTTPNSVVTAKTCIVPG